MLALKIISSRKPLIVDVTYTSGAKIPYRVIKRYKLNDYELKALQGGQCPPYKAVIESEDVYVYPLFRVVGRALSAFTINVDGISVGSAHPTKLSLNLRVSMFISYFFALAVRFLFILIFSCIHCG